MHPNHGLHLRDPVNGDRWFFDSPDKAVQLNELALKTGITFREIYRMARVAIHKTLDALDDAWVSPDKHPSLDELKHDAERLDEPSNSFRPGLQELLEIRERSLQACRWLLSRETDPVKRMQLEAQLVPSATWLRIEAKAREILAKQRAN